MSMGAITHGLGGVSAAQRYRVPTNANDPLRQRIMDALKARLETILIAGGYKTDAGKNVFAWRKFGIPDTELPALVYQDTDHTQDQGAIDLVDNFLEVTVEAIAIKGATSEDQIREMLADVITAIGTDETWGGLAFDTSQPSTPMDAEQMEKKLFGSRITFTIEYNTERFNAYQ